MGFLRWTSRLWKEFLSLHIEKPIELSSCQPEAGVNGATYPAGAAARGPAGPPGPCGSAPWRRRCRRPGTPTSPRLLPSPPSARPAAAAGGPPAAAGRPDETPPPESGRNKDGSCFLLSWREKMGLKRNANRRGKDSLSQSIGCPSGSLKKMNSHSICLMLNESHLTQIFKYAAIC